MRIASLYRMKYLFCFAYQLTYLCSSSSFISPSLACTVSPRISAAGRSSAAFSPTDGAVASLLGFGRCPPKPGHRSLNVQSCSSHFRMRIPCDLGGPSPKVCGNPNSRPPAPIATLLSRARSCAPNTAKAHGRIASRPLTPPTAHPVPRPPSRRTCVPFAVRPPPLPRYPPPRPAPVPAALGQAGRGGDGADPARRWGCRY